jgi:hypothetical protein
MAPSACENAAKRLSLTALPQQFDGRYGRDARAFAALLPGISHLLDPAGSDRLYII